MSKAALTLSIREKLGYGLGDTASHFVWDMVGFWILIFYTDTFGISAAAAGTIMLIARLWDMASDPIMGILADRTSTRWGKFRPYLLWVAAPYAVLAVLAFSTPNLGPTGKVVYAAITYLLLMTAYTAINLPYSSLGAVMTADGYERASLNTYRFVCAFAGQLVVAGLALTMARKLGGGDDARGYQLTLVVFGAISFAFFMIAFASTKERVRPPATQRSSLREDLRVLFANTPWIVLSVVGLLSFVMFALQNASLAFYFKYYVGDAESVQLFNVIGSLALIAGLPLSGPLSKRFGKRNVFIASSLLSGVAFGLIVLPGARDLVTIYVLNIVGKFTYAPAVPLLWTMLADTADFSEWTTGRRATGLFFSASTFAQKGGWGIGGALAGWILAVFGYVEQSAVQSVEAVTGIRLMVSVFPGVLSIVCAALLMLYRLDAPTCLRMQEELEARRADVTNPPSTPDVVGGRR
ncbi:MAG: MFS transporter [Holophagae bacterium]|jgi:GPH family glycoside/pentoside/hexuronide:cation symporter